MVTPRKRGGIGAVGSAKMNAVHPSAPLKERYGTGYERDRLTGPEILRKNKRKVSSRGRVVDRYFS